MRLYKLLLVVLLLGCGNDNITDKSTNNPPAVPSNPFPANAATETDTIPRLSWECSDPDGDSLTYDLYFGTSIDMPKIDSGLTEAEYIPGQLDEFTTYYWRVVAWDSNGDSTAGPIWHFSTYGNYSPTVPSDPNPADGATNLDLDIQLNWQSSDPEGEILTYFIFFGTVSNPPLLDSTQTKPYDPGQLQYGTSYYWKIVASDEQQQQTEGPVWTFATRPEPDTVYFVGSYYPLSNAGGLYVSGDYAYIADGPSGLQIIDITNPANPSFLGSYDTPGFALDVFMLGDIAYIADGGSGLRIVEVSVPSSPFYIGDYDTPGYARAIFISGNHAYVADSDSGLQIIDISDPSNPTLEGGLNTPGEAWGVYVSGNFAYVADYTGGLQIIDITDPSNPVLTAGHLTPGQEAMSVFVSGSYAYVADGFSGGLQVIDISNPSAPDSVFGFDTHGTARDVYVSDLFVYVADFDQGLQIINKYEPMSTPSLVAQYDTPTNALGVFVYGGYIFVADFDGLQILQFE